ncbi:O-Mevalon transferase yanI [Hypsizygus marmoreus]|uniref:O-Mevalon transferase yanI n=1 Tax=Hypsizygus marmoreus TaxID=39966 RepID=A0A369JF60_HYPMA|nr:O-Mevalon transferase yanI [Hypsizygus marmoreus]
MGATFGEEFVFAAHRAVRTIIPRLQDRIAVSWRTAPYPFIYYLPFFFMAYLARRQDTYLIRLLLLPATICGIVAAAYRFVWTTPALNVYNWGQCLFAAVAIAKTLEYALNKEGMLKIGEIRPGVMKGKGTYHGNPNGISSGNPTGTSNGHAAPVVDCNQSSVPPWLYDTIELTHTLRGLQWKFGQGIHIPKQTRPLERQAFLHATLLSFIKNFLIVDFLESTLKLFPGVGSPMGGSMFYPNLPLFWRYSVATLIHMMTGTAILVGFGMVYDLITLVAVGCFDSSPTSWPPVTDDPWTADSMHNLWAKQWHQLLRQTFLVLGGYPGKWIAGNLGMLFGTFIASGLFHECAMYSMGHGFNHTAPLFFALQGPLLILERWWRKVTGRRVGGLWGRLWVYFIVFITAQPMVDAWHRRGLGGGMVIPPFISPTKLLLVPLVQKAFNIKTYQN